MSPTTKIPGRELTLGVGLLLIVLALNVVIAYRSVGTLNASAAAVHDANSVLDSMDALFSTLQDAETGQRGYVITGNDAFLAPYVAAKDKVDGYFDQLKSAAKDDAARQDRLRLLRPLIDQKMSELAATIEMRKTSFEDARARVAGGEGKRAMDAIRDVLGAMRRHEGQVLDEREQDMASAFRSAIWSIGLCAAVAALGLLGFWLLLGRYIRARDLAEATIFGQRELLRATLSSIGDAMISTDADGQITFLNAVAETLTGWKQADAAGQSLETVFRIVNETTREPVENPALRAIREGAIVGLANHTVLLSKDGRECMIDDSAAPIRTTAGAVAGAVLVFRDVTKQRRLERAARQATEERLQLLSLTAQIGEALTVNRPLEEMLERCAQTLTVHLGAVAVQFWLPDNESRVLSPRITSPASGDHEGAPPNALIQAQTIEQIARDGQPRIVADLSQYREIVDADWATRAGATSFAGYPLAVGDKSIGVLAMLARQSLGEAAREALLAAARQISLGIDRKHAEETLANLLARESERSRRLRNLANASLTLNAATNIGSVLGVVNAEAKQLLGAQQSNVILDGKPAALPSTGLTVEMVGRGGRHIGQIHLDGKTQGPFTEDDQAILAQLAHMAAVAFDNARLYEELREGDMRKDEFLATLAHELRNPLAPIRNSLQVMRVAARDPEALEASRAMIERQVQQMVRLVDDLLDLSRVTRGKMHLHKQRLQLSGIVASAVETGRHYIDQLQHEFVVDQPDEPIWVDADPVRLAQVLVNLLNNAAKYTEPGGKVRLAVEPPAPRAGEGSMVAIRVSDTGIGISAEMLPQVFDMFTQADQSLERSQGGLGVGLTLVRRLVEMHGGRVEAISAGAGQGSEFVVRLPVATAPADRPAAKTNRDEGRQMAKQRVLVVDDNRDSADSLAMLLRLKGSEVRIAYDGVEAVDAATEFKPAIVLLDIGLPRLNGYEAARQIRQKSGDDWRPVLVALTGWGQDEDKRRSKEAGFDHHLVKPVSPDVLEKLLASIAPDKGTVSQA